MSGQALSESQSEAGRLDAGLERLNLSLSVSQHQQLLDYVALLFKWNKVYNLTAVRSPLQMIDRHILDSLAIVRYVTGPRILDIGTGAGLPGIPLAICHPALSCTMLDSNGKKTRFVQQTLAELKLQNASVVQSRVEDCQMPPFDQIITRAFSSPVDILERAAHLCTGGGTMLFMMGRVDGLLDKLPEQYALTRLDSIDVPFTDGERHLASVKRIATD